MFCHTKQRFKAARSKLLLEPSLLKDLHILTAAMNEFGTVTRDQFNREISKFAEYSDAFNEAWCCRHVEGNPECVYLVKRQRIFVTECYEDMKSTHDKFQGEDIESSANEALVDDAVYPDDDKQRGQFVTFEYHVVYSPSYNVPVLYFSAWTQDGKRLSLNEIWDRVSLVHQHFLHHDKWSFITQQEHPLLLQPFFLVHPCHTADFMKLLSRDNLNIGDQCSCRYLITWLSAVGPTVGLRLPLQFAFDMK